MIPIGMHTYFIIKHAIEHYQYSENIGKSIMLNLVESELHEDGTSERLDEFRIAINIQHRDNYTTEEAAEYAEALIEAVRIADAFNSLDIQFDDTYDDSCLKENYRERWQELSDILHYADSQEIAGYLKSLWKTVVENSRKYR